MHNRIVATRRFEKWETFSSPCPPRYKPFQKETHSNRSAFPDSNNVCLRFPPFSFTPLPFHPRPTIVLYRVFHENAFSRLPSFIFPFPFLFLPDSPWFPRVLVTTGSSIRNESVSREWRVSRNREFQGGIKGNFIVPEDGGTNGSRFSFTNVSITRERSSLRSEKSREPPLLLVSEYILISIEISLCHDARGRKLVWKIGRIESRSFLPRIVRVIARMEEGAGRENCDLIERIPIVSPGWNPIWPFDRASF